MGWLKIFLGTTSPKEMYQTFPILWVRVSLQGIAYAIHNTNTDGMQHKETMLRVRTYVHTRARCLAYGRMIKADDTDAALWVENDHRPLDSVYLFCHTCMYILISRYSLTSLLRLDPRMGTRSTSAGCYCQS